MLFSIDYIFTVLPVIISLLAAILLFFRYKKYKQTHHIFLCLFFVLLCFSYLSSFFISLKKLSLTTSVFPLRQSVNLLLIPFYSFCGYSLFLGVDIPRKKVITHALPAIFVFIGFIPFWFLSDNIQESYFLSDLKNTFDNSILYNTDILRKISINVLFNSQLIFYHIYIIPKFRKFDAKSPVTLHRHPGTGVVSVILLFTTFLLVLINYALILGVYSNINSRLFFNIMSVIILSALFISIYQKKQSIAKQEIADTDDYMFDTEY